jgi:hypothetical protein
MRKACIEPIRFQPDGSIREVEMTSQGAGGPLPATSTIEAEQACLLYGNVRIQAFANENEELGGIVSGDRAGFKYVDFKDGVKKIVLRIAPGKDGGRIVVAVDQPWYKRLANITIDGVQGERQWQTLTFDVGSVSGVHALWLQFAGSGRDLFSIDWIRFE